MEKFRLQKSNFKKFLYFFTSTVLIACTGKSKSSSSTKVSAADIQNYKNIAPKVSSVESNLLESGQVQCEVPFQSPQDKEKFKEAGIDAVFYIYNSRFEEVARATLRGVEDFYSVKYRLKNTADRLNSDIAGDKITCKILYRLTKDSVLSVSSEELTIEASTSSQTNTATNTSTSSAVDTETELDSNTPTPTLSPTPSASVFDEFLGLTSLQVPAGKRVRLNWQPPSNTIFDRYFIYQANSSMTQDFSQPTLVVLGREKNSVVVSGLADNTEYYFVVRAGNAMAQDTNQIELSATTLANPVPLPTRSYFQNSLALRNYHFVKKEDLNLGEITTVLGKLDTPWGLLGTEATPLADGFNFGGGFNAGVDLVVDSEKNIYIPNPGGTAIYKVDSYSGLVSNFVGNGTAGFSGDNGPASAAQVQSVKRMVIDSVGNFFFSDGVACRIRKIGTNGIISTVAGDGTCAYGGDGDALTSSLYAPNGLDIDPNGDLYVSEFTRVRKLSGTTISTFAGNSTRGFAGDGGPATSALFGSSTGIIDVAVDNDGVVYVLDNSTRVRKITTDGIVTSMFASNFPNSSEDGLSAASTSLYHTYGIQMDYARNNLLLAETESQKVRRWDRSSDVITTVVGTGTYGLGASNIGAPATSAHISRVVGIAADADGTIYYYDRLAEILAKKPQSGVIHAIGGAGAAAAKGISSDNAPATSVMFVSGIGDVVRLNDGTVYFTDQSVALKKLGTNGQVETVASGYPADRLAVTPQGDIVFSSASRKKIFKLDTQNNVTEIAGNGTQGFSGDGGSALSSSLFGVAGVAVDLLGNVYFAESNTHRIRKVDTQGLLTTVAGTGTSGFGADGVATSSELKFPSAVSLDSSGSLYISDNTARVRKLTSGNIITIIGTGTSGFSGDGGPATAAQVSSGFVKLVFDSSGNTYFSDSGNYRIRKIDVSGNVSTLAGNGSYKHSGDGSPATAAGLVTLGIYLDSAGNLFSAGDSKIRMIRLAP